MSAAPSRAGRAAASAAVALVAAATALALRPAIACAWVPPGRLAPIVSYAPEVTAAVPGQDILLVGRSGQIYRPDGDGTWRRSGGGGVAVDLVGAVRKSKGTIVGVGAHTPIFEWADGSWRVGFLPRHGPVVLAHGGGPVALAVGRDVYLLEGARWHRIAIARRRITAVWASSRKRVYVVAGGDLLRGSGRSWTRIRTPLAHHDHIALLAGLPRHTLLAVSGDGRVLSVGGRRATRVKIPPRLASLEVQAAGATSSAVLLAGVVDSDGGRRGVLVRAAKTGLRVAADLGALSPRDRFVAVVSGGAGAVVAVTRGGRVLTVRRGGKIAVGAVRPGLPAAARRAFAGRGPARTR